MSVCGRAWTMGWEGSFERFVQRYTIVRCTVTLHTLSPHIARMIHVYLDPPCLPILQSTSKSFEILPAAS